MSSVRASTVLFAFLLVRTLAAPLPAAAAQPEIAAIDQREAVAVTTLALPHSEPAEALPRSFDIEDRNAAANSEPTVRAPIAQLDSKETHNAEGGSHSNDLMLSSVGICSVM